MKWKSAKQRKAVMARIGGWRKLHKDDTKTLMHWTNESPQWRGLPTRNRIYSYDKETGRWALLDDRKNIVLMYFPTKKAVKEDAVQYMRKNPRGI
jgi:hypothetical protein